MLIDIALDAVGTDRAPEPEIRGAILACKELPVRVHLVGPERELRDQLDEMLDDEDLPIVIHHASERIGMEEKAAHAVRTKRDSSLRVGLKLVREVVMERPISLFFTSGDAEVRLQGSGKVFRVTRGQRSLRGCLAKIEF